MPSQSKGLSIDKYISSKLQTDKTIIRWQQQIIIFRTIIVVPNSKGMRFIGLLYRNGTIILQRIYLKERKHTFKL